MIISGPVDNIRRYDIMAAMDGELSIIQADMKIEDSDTIAQRIFTIGTIEGKPCICIKAGVGKVNAALAVEILTLEYDVDALIYTGVAGGINPSLEIGDVVIGERILYHDFGKITPGQSTLFDTLGFRADTSLINTACAAINYVHFDPVPEPIAKTKNRFPQIKIGRIATGDQFIASEEKREWFEKILGVDCGHRRSPGVHN